MVPAKDMSTVSHRARPATGSTEKSGGTISDVRMPRLRRPRISFPLSKNPSSFRTIPKSRAIRAVMRRFVFIEASRQ